MNNETKAEGFLNEILDLMCTTWLIKDYPFGRTDGEKIMDILERWVKSED